MKFSPGCNCCVDCSHLPDQLYLKSQPWTGTGPGSTPGKVPFSYDAASGLWLCAVTIGTGFGMDIRNATTCAGTGTSIVFVYQMTAAFLLTRQIEICKLDANGLPFGFPQNTAPGSLSGSNLFGPAATSTTRGTYTRSTTGTCSNPPLLITVFLSSPAPNAYPSETVEITNVP